MTAIRLPDVIINEHTGPFENGCGGLAYTHKIYDSTTKTINSDYKTLIANGQRVPCLDYIKFVSETVDNPGVYKRWYLNSGDIQFDNVASFINCVGGLGSFTMDVTDARNKAQVSFYAAAGKLRKANMAESGIELAQSVNLIASSATKLANIYLDLKKGNFRRAFGIAGLKPQRRVPKWVARKYGTKTVYELQKFKRKEYLLHKRKKDYSKLARQAGDTWLEIHFGWLPILNDIYSISNAVTDVLYAKRPELFRIHGYGESPVEFTNSNPEYADFSGTGKCYCAITGFYTIDDVSAFNQQTMGLRNPAAAFWAAVPYSFVVDWILPVQSYFNALSATAGLQWLDGCRSTMQKASMFSNYNRSITNPDWNWGEVLTCSARSKFVYYEREAPYTVSAPALPTLNLPAILDTWKITTSLALMKSALVYR